jgi:hypothetical protein
MTIKTFIAAIFLTAMLSPVFAHPPSNIVASFDSTKKELKVFVYHDVKDQFKHYIGNIYIERNGNKIIEQNFSSQIDLTQQIAVYTIIDIRPGDELVITAVCNISGKKTVKFPIAASPTPAPAGK